MLLAIDTATPLLSLALHDGDRLVAECTFAVDRKHSAVLAPLIKQMLTQTDTTTSDISSLAVSVGPGSYTGLRIGVALAKGMAAARDLALVPVTTLDTIAAASSAANRSLPLIVTVPAGRSRIIWAIYRCEGDARRISGEMKLGSWDDLLAACHVPCTLTGEIDKDGLQKVHMARDAGERITLLSPAERFRRAGYMAQIAWGRLRSDDDRLYPADQVMPIYLKSP
ncbi:MAG: tRNA (adenosine(37)-N6)-threonylcarbamoyltransferase complex dimerization subunit type 1 TsaB [Chloroflexi bacterium]|nr:tRNA (adenosine(37)-N6)-threonylcarbamoyltransferase complex dimerization subunit type 1 TsaB [Chloroflexota bacterium]